MPPIDLKRVREKAAKKSHQQRLFDLLAAIEPELERMAAVKNLPGTEEGRVRVLDTSRRYGNEEAKRLTLLAIDAIETYSHHDRIFAMRLKTRGKLSDPQRILRGRIERVVRACCNFLSQRELGPEDPFFDLRPDTGSFRRRVRRSLQTFGLAHHRWEGSFDPRKYRDEAIGGIRLIYRPFRSDCMM